MLTEAGPVEISVPRDRDASFEPRIVAKRQRRLTGVDDLVLSLSAKGLTHGQIAAHLAEVMAPRFPSKPFPRSLTGCWRGWANGRTARLTRCIR